MKRWIFAMISILILLGSTACASKPKPSIPEEYETVDALLASKPKPSIPEEYETVDALPASKPKPSIPEESETVDALQSSIPEISVPDDTYDLAYDMQNYDYFAEIFDEKTMDEWANMGVYTILLKGLHTPVLVAMDGMDVLSVCAYGQTVELGTAGAAFQDSTPASIRSTEDAVVVNLTWDFVGETIILTEDQYYKFQREGDISTQVFVQEDGTLAYGRYWGEYATSFEQWDTAPLDLCTSRDHFLYETGYAEIGNGEVILTPERTVTVSDEYDLDAMFAEAKASGMYEEYETVDALLASN